MKRTRMWALAVCLCLPLQLSAGVPLGTVTDPADDAEPSPNDDPDPDLISASVTSDGTDLHLSVRFKPGTFDQALTLALFSLDTDQDPSTGNPGTSSNCVTDCDLIGTEFGIDIGGSLGTEARVLRFVPGSGFFVDAGVGTVTFEADGMDAVVPLALLGNDDGLLNYKVVILEEISGAGGTSSELDRMPDGGLPAAMSALDGTAGPPTGAVTDPDNDAAPSPNDDPDPDAVSASVTSDGTDLHLSVRFKPGTFDQALTIGTFSLDVDQDPSTGNPGTTSNCVTDCDLIGREFVVDIGANLGTEARVLRFVPGSGFFVDAGVGTVTFEADGMDAVVPLALLGDDDGRLNFKVRILEQISGTGSSGTLDTIPDVGLPAAMSALHGPAGALTITGIFNAATSVPEGQPGHAASPGSAVAVFGEGFASHLASPSPVPLSSQQIPLDTNLGDLTATVDGMPLALFGVFRGEDSGAGFDQLNGQLPWELLAGPKGTTATLVITSNGVSSEPREISLAPASPGIYSWEFGPGPGIVTNFIADDPGRVEFAQRPGTFCTSFNLAPDLCAGELPPGSVLDPDNDASPSPNEDPDPDLVSANVTSDGTDLHLSVRYKAGTFDPALAFAQFLLDTDQDPSTGTPTTGCAADSENGADYVVGMGAFYGTETRLLTYLGTCDAFDFELAGTVTFVEDGMDAVMPLAVLGGDDGRVNFKVTLSELISANRSTGVLDVMPDAGLPAGMSAIVGAPLRAKGTPIVNENPAKIDGIITLWANGLGPLTGTVPSGDIPEPGAPILFAAKTVRVFIGGIEAQVLGAFLQSQFVALNQINAIVPAGVEPGDAVPIVIEVDCGDGNVFRSRDDVTIAIAAAE